MGHFLGQTNEALLILKDLQPNRPDKATYLANHKKLGCGHGPSCQPLHVQYSSDGSRSLTTLTTPRGEHHGGGLGRGRHDSGSPRGEDYEGSLVRLWCEATVVVGPGQQWE